MSKKMLWWSINLKTNRCLREGRLRNKSFRKLLGRSSNLLFSLILVTLMATVVHAVYQMPVPSSLEVKIHAGEMISDDEVPVVAQAKAMRITALEEEARMQVNKEIRNYAERFIIDVKLADLIYKISKDEALDPNLVFKIIWTESRFKKNCIGEKGEIGLMQVKYETALHIDPGATQAKLFDPAYNIRIGLKHLKDQLHFYRGDMKLALLAYNRGRGKVNQLLLLGLNPANGYAQKILEKNM